MAAHQISTKLTNFSASLVRELALFVASGLSLVAAAVHLWAVPEHLAEWWGYGAFFVAATLAQGLFGVALLRWPSRPLFLLGIGGNLALVSAYVVTRTAGIPFFGPHAGVAEVVGTLDLFAVASELALVAVLIGLGGLVPHARNLAATALAQALGAGLVLHLLYVGAHGSSGFVSHWLTDSLLSAPLSLLALMVSAPLSGRFGRSFHGAGVRPGFRARAMWALAAGVAYAGLGVPANAFAASGAEALRNAGPVAVAAFAVLLAVSLLRGLPDEEPRSLDLSPASFWRPRAATALVGIAAGLFVLVGPGAVGPGAFEMFSSPPVQAQAAPGSCSSASYDRSYDVAAANVDIPYNRFAQTRVVGGETVGLNMDPNGQAFVLQGDQAAVENWFRPLGATPAEDPAGADNRRLRPRPLVIRANAGECVKVTLTNELEATGGDGLPNNPRVGIKVYGPAYDAQTSDGSAVGYNADTTVGMGETISYYWKAPSEEGTFLFRDQGALAGSEANSGSVGHGLYGAFVVEPAGSTWLDPETGQPLYAGGSNGKTHNRLTRQSGDSYIDATIVALGGAFRESVQISQDELPGGNGFAFGYGAEPASNRIAKNPAGENPAAEQAAPDAVGEETSLSSWTYGDPALIKLASGMGPWLPDTQRTNKEDCGLESSCYVSNVTRAYPKDPSKIRFINAGVKETHVFHMHAHQWNIEPNNPNSTKIDSQTFGPGEGFTADLIGGAGSKPGTFGDSIFHCHLYPHFADGFWALFRVHDVLEDGTGKLPDGTKVRELKALPDRAAETPDGPTADNPGYPRFIPGKYGWRAPQPPLGISENNGEPDKPDTVAREDLSPATRVVAGKPLDPGALADPKYASDTVAQDLASKLTLEKKVMTRNAGPSPNPGAPFKEPCPSGSREVTYNVSVIQRDVTYNERGDHDTQGRIMVPTKDVEKYLAKNPDGTYKNQPEPLFIRVNAGDCVNFNLTNYLPNWYGGDAFVKLAQTNMVGGHIHLVKFDVLASDGSSNGWNYQQAAFSDEQADFNKDVVAGNKPCNWNGCRIEDAPPDWDPNNANSGQIPPGQTISERWYADTELRTVFTHDHHFAALDQNRGYFGAMVVEPKGMDFRNPKTGQFYQPGNGNVPGAPNCGSSCTGDAAGAAMDIIGPGASDDFREFGIAIQDFVSLTKKGGDSRLKSDVINGPAEPEDFPDEDPGTMAINYRNAPFQYRQTDGNGNPSDPAYTFSSAVHGDPMTPIMQTYSGDPVKIRAIQGSQEEQHVLSMNGVRWRKEPGDPNSPLVSTEAIGISEAFNFEVPKISCAATDQSCAGDYLYGGTATDDLYEGAWGLLRARAERVPSLLPLPDNVPAAQDQTPEPGEGTGPGSPTAPSPPEATSPGNPCPTGIPASKVKTFNVVAMQAKITYNKQGDNDPFGLVYALAEDAPAIRSGEKEPEPLVLRANQGDCIQVRLTNEVSSDWLRSHGNAGTNGDPVLPSENAEGTRAGLRVSLNPQLVKYDVRGSDGAAVGYNRDSTVAPGDTRLYRWYADEELGTTNLTDWGDVRGHRHHGLSAGLNIEPEGSTYHDPATGEPIRSGVAADIRVPGADNDFREFTTFFQDGLNLRDASGAIIEDPLDHPPTPDEPEGTPMDAEDQGEKGFNYANAPFVHRIGDIPATGPDGDAMAHVFDSSRHGDPDTPIFRSYAGDRIKVRVLQGGDKPRQHTFQISGQGWKAQPDDPASNFIGTQGGISVGRAFNIDLPTGFVAPGDYRYGDDNGGYHLAGGEWGIMRIYSKPSAAQAINPTPLGNVDNPHAGGHPILPLEAQNIATSVTLGAAPTSVQPGGSTVLSGRLSATGGPLANRQVTLKQRPAGSTAAFTAVPNSQATTDGEGNFRIANISPDRTTEYQAVFAGNSGAGLEPSVSAGVRVVVMGETAIRATASPAVVFGQATNVTGSLMEDAKPVAGKPVALEQRPAGQTAFTKVGAPVNTDANGRFMFSGIKPTKNTDYRVVFAGETSTGLKPSEAVVPVKVRAAVTLTASAANLKLGGSRAISGSVAPAHKGTVKLIVKRNGSPVLSKTLSLGATSRFAYTYRPTTPGVYAVQATFAGDADHLTNSSATKSFRVIR